MRLALVSNFKFVTTSVVVGHMHLWVCLSVWHHKTRDVLVSVSRIVQLYAWVMLCLCVGLLPNTKFHWNMGNL